MLVEVSLEEGEFWGEKVNPVANKGRERRRRLLGFEKGKGQKRAEQLRCGMAAMGAIHIGPIVT